MSKIIKSVFFVASIILSNKAYPINKVAYFSKISHVQLIACSIWKNIFAKFTNYIFDLKHYSWIHDIY